MRTVSLRKIKISDTNNIVKWRNSDAIMNVFIDRKPLTKKQHYSWLENNVKTGKVEQFIIVCDKKDIGSVYLRDIDTNHRKAEIGIFIGEQEYRGLGLGKQIINKAVDYAFDELDLNKVFARILKFNKPSYYTFKNAGFHRDAILREDVIIDGERIDVYIMSILRKERRKNEFK